MDSAEAFAAIALAAVACDGGLDHDEARSLRGQLEGRHPFSGRSEESMGRLFDGLLDQLRSDGWRALIGQAVPALSPSQQETALAMGPPSWCTATGWWRVRRGNCCGTWPP